MTSPTVKRIWEILSPIIYSLFFAEPEGMIVIMVVRLVCNFLLGVILAYFMWILVTIQLDLYVVCPFVSHSMLIFILFLLFNGTTFMLSRRMRAITLLIFVSLAGSGGKYYLRALAFAMVITGPVHNLVANGAEVARVFACSTQLTYNLTKTRFDLMAKPFTNTLQNMKDDINEIEDNFKELHILLEDLKFAVEHEQKLGEETSRVKHLHWEPLPVNDSYGNYSQPVIPQASKFQEKFLHDIRNHCKHQLNSGYQVCEEVFDQGFQKCGTNFPEWMSNAICWPYRVDIICKVNMFSNPDQVCDASKVLTPDFGKIYVQFLASERELFENSTNMQISYRKHNVTTSAQLRSAQSTTEAFLKDFESCEEFFDFVMSLIVKFLCLFIFLMTFSAVYYYYRYQTDIEFDNIYISEYFKHLDARRSKVGQESLLPLLDYEKSAFIDVDDIWKQNDTTTIRDYHLMQLAIEICPALLFIILSNMLSSLLLTINCSSLVTYNQAGEHEVRFRINGTGLMARLLRTTMKNFNIHERVSTSLTNVECLPVAEILPYRFYVKIILIYLLILALLWKGKIVLRLRRLICLFFYPEREKQRIQFLYGCLLRNRKSIDMDMLLAMAEKNLGREHMSGNVNLFMVIYTYFPDKFSCLKNSNCTKCRCLICHAVEDDKFVKCPKCVYPYCGACYKDMNKFCIFCHSYIKSDEKGGNEANKNKKVDAKKLNPPDTDGTSVDLYTYRKKK